MLKSKILLLAGALVFAGAAGGTALLASAQTSTTTSAPATVTTSANTGSSSAVDKSETLNDPADNDTDSQGQRSGLHKEANDSDGGAAGEANEGASTSGASDQ